MKHRIVEHMSSSTADALGLSRAILCNGKWLKTESTVTFMCQSLSVFFFFLPFFVSVTVSPFLHIPLILSVQYR